MKAPGRWHHAGRPIVYLAGSPAAALLEVCVHTCANDVPPEFTLLRIEGNSPVIKTIKADELPGDWTTRPEVTCDIGTAWLEGRKSELLRVPSAIVPETVNFLLNPMHVGAPKFRIQDVFSYPFDVRLKR